MQYLHKFARKHNYYIDWSELRTQIINDKQIKPDCHLLHDGAILTFKYCVVCKNYKLKTTKFWKYYPKKNLVSTRCRKCQKQQNLYQVEYRKRKEKHLLAVKDAI